MAQDNPTEIEKIPHPGVGTPESGTYGEKADLAALQAALPPMGPPPQPGAGQATTGQPSPVISPAPPAQNNSPMQPSGVPPVLLEPTARPGEPIATFPQPSPVPTATDMQRRLQLLDQLANSDQVSPETREWARMYIDMLVG